MAPEGGICAQQVHPTSDMDRYIQIKQEKHFHPGNAAVRQWDLVGLPIGRMCYSSFNSTSAEHRERTVKHEDMNSLGPWHHDQVTACQNCSQPLKKTAWEKLGNPHHYTALQSDL